jgi:hypothetical protein
VFVSHFKKVTPTIYKNKIYKSMFLTNKSQVHYLEEWFSQYFFLVFKKGDGFLFVSHFKKQMTIKGEFLIVFNKGFG